MKLGLSMWSVAAVVRKGEMDIPGFIEFAKSLDVDGVELLDFFWNDRESEIPLVQAALAKTGLPVGVYSVGNNFVVDNQEAWEQQVQIVKYGIDWAEWFGADTVRVFAGDVKENVSFHDACCNQPPRLGVPSASELLLKRQHA